MQKRRILLVDDEPAIIKIVGKRLELAGYEVVVAMDGEEALAKARLGRHEALVLDLMLPKRNGLEVCAELKQDPKTRHIPIIIFTGKGKEMDETLCRECGADAYITKSPNTRELLEQVETLLARALLTIEQQPSADASSTTPT